MLAPPWPLARLTDCAKRWGMKFTLSWLKDHLETTADVAGVEAAMTMAGLEVEEVIDTAAALQAFSVARVVSVAPHPNADKLQVCQVDTKDGRKEIVCGALNARAGLMTAYAPIGTYIPGSGITLEPKPVRGVVSLGMLCSESELQIADDPFGLRGARFAAYRARAVELGVSEDKARADGGIMELPDDAEIGAPVAALLGLDDPVIDFEVTPNRPDWLGVAGIARDLAAAGLGKFKGAKTAMVTGDFDSPVTIAIDAPDACPMFAAILIRGLKNGPSPAWLQARLRAIGIKPRNVLVDVTNYISIDRARPLHVYDAAKLTGVVRARMGREGESFRALDGKDYAVSPDMCVIADDRGVLGLGGVMGGEASGSSDATVDVLIESAWFDPARTLRTGRATGITSDAQYRFARGVDPGFVLDGLHMAAAMIVDLCGGQPSRPMVVGRAPEAPNPVAFDPDRVRTLAGMDVAPTRVVSILQDLGFSVSGKGAALMVTPPTWRRDVEGAADLVEEVARIEGFDKLPEVAPPRAPGMRAPTASVGESRTRLGRRALAAQGYLEAITWSFCAHAHAVAFGGGDARLVLANPIAADLDCMRPSALPNLLRAAQRNADRGFGDARLFEAGPAFSADGSQTRTLTAVWLPKARRHWAAAENADVFTMKSLCVAMLEALGAPTTSMQVGPPMHGYWHPGKAGVLKLGPKIIAAFGVLHPRALQAIGVDRDAMALEIFIDALPVPKAKRARGPLEKNDLMPLSRDFAFVVAEAVSAGDLVRAIAGADKSLITDVSVFDLYRGVGIPEGKKSLAFEVTLQPKEKTLTDADIDSLSGKIIAAATKLGASLRA